MQISFGRGGNPALDTCSIHPTQQFTRNVQAETSDGSSFRWSRRVLLIRVVVFTHGVQLNKTPHMKKPRKSNRSHLCVYFALHLGHGMLRRVKRSIVSIPIVRLRRRALQTRNLITSWVRIYHCMRSEALYCLRSQVCTETIGGGLSKTDARISRQSDDCSGRIGLYGAPCYLQYCSVYT